MTMVYTQGFVRIPLPGMLMSSRILHKQAQ
ncbi:hypothetical protein SAMN04490203_3500 [Pseudomonas taetrolens]|uniref:Uncharacterized protein n=1 Tax=Pseudomonas taetrolens TaxID=47884 RepID=A0A1H4WU95_PSETA|nr:hypothetical protein SAMN04490203_3500 [Pseudomonas taetrolens]SQF87541.1 Uncharacterised protein [Pseudomonas taetrolens]VEH50734.1 Uncharacterised protein [Pseudomonas taetrolens]